MAHFAELDENNFVTKVIVIDNDKVLDENGEESEIIGIEYCKNLFVQDTQWIQTSYNNNFRKRFAGIGSRYLPDKDIFTTASMFPSWTYNEELDEWEPPVPRPESGENYFWVWNESILSWDIVYFVPSQESQEDT